MYCLVMPYTINMRNVKIESNQFSTSVTAFFYVCSFFLDFLFVGWQTVCLLRCTFDFC